MSCQPPGDRLTRAQNEAFERELAAERLARMRRQARRYLEAHCDAHGRRYESGLTVHEFADELHIADPSWFGIVAEERRELERRHGAPAPTKFVTWRPAARMALRRWGVDWDDAARG